MNNRVALVVDNGTVTRQDHPVAILQIADGVGERAQRDGVRTEVHFALAVADGERRPVACTDHQIFVARENEPECECAAKLRQCRLDRIDRLESLAEQIIDEMQNDLGVGLGFENRALFLQAFAQFAEVLDDAVMNYCDAGGGMRMRVVFRRLAVGGPARVSDAGVTRQRFGSQSRFKILEFAFGATPLEMVAFQRGDAGGIVAAIFKPLERIDQLLRNRSAPQNADNAAHADQTLQIGEKTALIRLAFLNENRGSADTQ